MNQSDHTHLFAAQKGMQDAISTMEKLAPALGMAKQIVEFTSDRRRFECARSLLSTEKSLLAL